LAAGVFYPDAKIVSARRQLELGWASEVKEVKDFIQSERMQDVFKQVDEISAAPMEFVWLEELTLTSIDKVIFAPLAVALDEW